MMVDGENKLILNTDGSGAVAVNAFSADGAANGVTTVLVKELRDLTEEVRALNEGWLKQFFDGARSGRLLSATAEAGDKKDEKKEPSAADKWTGSFMDLILDWAKEVKKPKKAPPAGDGGNAAAASGAAPGGENAAETRKEWKDFRKQIRTDVKVMFVESVIRPQATEFFKILQGWLEGFFPPEEDEKDKQAQNGQSSPQDQAQQVVDEVVEQIDKEMKNLDDDKKPKNIFTSMLDSMAEAFDWFVGGIGGLVTKTISKTFGSGGLLSRILTSVVDKTRLFTGVKKEEETEKKTGAGMGTPGEGPKSDGAAPAPADKEESPQKDPEEEKKYAQAKTWSDSVTALVTERLLRNTNKEAAAALEKKDMWGVWRAQFKTDVINMMVESVIRPNITEFFKTLQDWLKGLFPTPAEKKQAEEEAKKAIDGVKGEIAGPPLPTSPVPAPIGNGTPGAGQDGGKEGEPKPAETLIEAIGKALDWVVSGIGGLVKDLISDTFGSNGILNWLLGGVVNKLKIFTGANKKDGENAAADGKEEEAEGLFPLLRGRFSTLVDNIGKGFTEMLGGLQNGLGLLLQGVGGWVSKLFGGAAGGDSSFLGSLFSGVINSFIGAFTGMAGSFGGAAGSGVLAAQSLGTQGGAEVLAPAAFSSMALLGSTSMPQASSSYLSGALPNGLNTTGTGGVNINITVHKNGSETEGGSRESEDAVYRRMARRVKEVVREELSYQQMPGGVLYK